MNKKPTNKMIKYEKYELENRLQLVEDELEKTKSYRVKLRVRKSRLKKAIYSINQLELEWD